MQYTTDQENYLQFWIKSTVGFLVKNFKPEQIGDVIRPIFKDVLELSPELFTKMMLDGLESLLPKNQNADPKNNHNNLGADSKTSNGGDEKKKDNKRALSEKDLEDIENFIKTNFGKSISGCMKDKRDAKNKKKSFEIIHTKPIPHPHINPGDSCECGHGKMYDTGEPKQETILNYIPGKLIKVRHSYQNLRCSGCQKYAYSPAVNIPGVLEKKSAELCSHVITNIANGIPTNRLQTIFRCEGIYFSRQSIDRIILVRGKELAPIVDVLKKRIANCALIGTDSTKFNVLESTSKKEDPNYKKGTLKKPEERSSSRASVVFGLNEEREFQGVVYSIGPLHCGEFLETDILTRRTVVEKLRLIGDLASSSDTSEYKIILSVIKKAIKKGLKKARYKGIFSDIDYLHACLPYIRVACNDHFMVYLKKAAENYPRLCVLMHMLKQVYEIDKICDNFSLNPQERLETHQYKSIALYEQMKKISKEFLSGSEKEIKAEPNSKEGKALLYFLKHYEYFMQFCKIAGVPLSNILSETALKWIILIRKNSWFLRTIESAESWANLISLCYTAHQLGLNAEAYLTNLFKNKDKWILNPEEWDPIGFLHRHERQGPLPRELTSHLYKGPVVESYSQLA